MKEKFNVISEQVIQLLNDRLPTYLTYHNVKHTLYVVEKAEYIAKKEGVAGNNLYLVKIAALYHDVGFITSHLNHEEEGCKIVRKHLPNYGFSLNEIKTVCGMIMATKIPQNPHSLLEEIVADADLEYFATKRFFPVSELLYNERKHFNNDLTREEWKAIQIEFLTKHKYHTTYCKRYKSFRKFNNIETLKQ